MGGDIHFIDAAPEHITEMAHLEVLCRVHKGQVECILVLMRSAPHPLRMHFVTFCHA